MSGFRLSPAETANYGEQGYLIRERAFGPGETRAIARESEALVDRLVRNRNGRRQTFGSYTFDTDPENGVVIKWEGETATVHGIEPFAHLSEPLRRWGYDPRFVEPMKDILDSDAPELFTEKLNLKRPHGGGVNPLHQDYPYWTNVADDASEVATAMLFLDDSSLVNGCLHVVPASHRRGQWPLSEDEDRFARNELDEGALGDLETVPVEVPAGSLILFGPFLLHRSAPNRSGLPRRALLYSYQPPGRITQLQALRRNLAARGASSTAR